MTRNETWIALYAAALGGLVAARAKDEKHFFGLSIAEDASNIANAAYLYLTSHRGEEMAEDAGYGNQQQIDQLNQEIVYDRTNSFQARMLIDHGGLRVGMTEGPHDERQVTSGTHNLRGEFMATTIEN
jgi:hypothetical protein